MIRSYQENPSASCSPAVPSGDTSPLGDIPSYMGAQQLADLKLTGLPTTKYHVLKLAERQGWWSVERIGRGGGRLYAIADLPESALRDLTDRRMNWVIDNARGRGRPKGTDYFETHPEVAAAVQGILATRRCSARVMAELLSHQFIDLPSPRTLQRYIARFERENRAVLASIRTPDQYKGKYRVSLGRADGGTTYAHQVWEIDTTPADIMTTAGRKAILGVIDRFSRRVNFMVADSESAQSVRRLLVETIRKWGVMPDQVMTDQGSGYINASIKSALQVLDINHYICPPASGDKKPFVERMFRTVQHERIEMLDGYVGHNVSEAQQLRSRARQETGRPEVTASLTPEQLQDILSNWLDGNYHLRDHGSLRMSPMRKWQSSTVPVRSAPGEDVLRLALSALVGPRTVGKKGIRWNGGSFWSPSLAAWMGREVMVRRDEDELGELFIFAPDNSFIDIAVDHTRLGISQETFAREARHHQGKLMAAQRKELKERARKFGVRDALQATLEREAEAAGKLAYLPQPTTPASSTAIDSINAAVAAAPTRRDAPAPVAPAPTPATPTSATVAQLVRTPEQKMRDADSIIARAEAGQLVDDADLRRARLYQTTSEYRATRALADHFASPATRDQAG